jgi:hypothetical protein
MAMTIEQSDHEEVARAASDRRPVDPDVARRIRERARKMREEILRIHGVQNIGVELIRELRDCR